MAKRILVIENDESTLQVIQFVLEEDGFVVIPSDTWEVVKLVSEINPDLILMDDLLDGKFGHDLCRWLKKQPDTGHIPIILTSAAPHLEQTAEQACADGFLVKPFDIVDIGFVIDAALSKTTGRDNADL